MGRVKGRGGSNPSTGTEAPSNGRPSTLAQPRGCLRRALFSLPPINCHSASGVLETRVPPIGTVHASDLWRFCGHRVSDARQRRPVIRAKRVLTRRVTPGMCLPNPRRDVNGPGFGRRGTERRTTWETAAVVQPSGASPRRLITRRHTRYRIRTSLHTAWHKATAIAGTRCPLSIGPATQPCR